MQWIGKTMNKEEQIRTMIYNGRKMFQCPECDELLPVDSPTECSNCGAWLTIKVETAG